MLEIQRLAAFTCGDAGGNPAGVVVCDELPSAGEMQRVAAEVGYSETVFAARAGDGYRVRYFAPTAEIPFCGHATIALGAALAGRGETGSIRLFLNDGSVAVEGVSDAAGLRASFRSAPTRHRAAPRELLDPAMSLFGLSPGDLDDRVPPAVIEAGARHLLLCLTDRRRLAAMSYVFDEGAQLMRAWNLATVCLVQAEGASRYHARNPFAGGGVYEDPATGAAAAALVAYLGNLGIAESESIEVVQGEDMGVPCLLRADAPSEPGGPARVQGTVRAMG